MQLTPSTTPGPDGNLPLLSSIFDGFHQTSGQNGFKVSNCRLVSTGVWALSLHPVMWALCKRPATRLVLLGLLSSHLQSAEDEVCCARHALASSVSSASQAFACAGDDMIAVHGRMYTMINTSASTLTVGAYTGGPPELNAGDTISLYSPIGQPLGSVTLKSVTSVPPPSGFNLDTNNVVFGGNFQGYVYFQVSCPPAQHPAVLDWAALSLFLAVHGADACQVCLCETVCCSSSM